MSIETVYHTGPLGLGVLELERRGEKVAMELLEPLANCDPLVGGRYYRCCRDPAEEGDEARLGVNGSNRAPMVKPPRISLHGLDRQFTIDIEIVQL
jgi:hypothetical protein